MPSPRLLVGDIHVGLTEVRDNVFEPKNLKVLRSTLYSDIPIDITITVITYFQNNSHNVTDILSDIERQMTGRPWNLIVIDNGSTDDTYEQIQSFYTEAQNYLHMSVARVYNRDKFRQICFSYAEEYLQSGELLKIFKNKDVNFEGESLESFCFMATKNVAKEALLLIYSIRCYHREPIYVICDSETEDYIKSRMVCCNVFFECSATKDNLQKITKENKKSFSKLDITVHRLDCIYQKMRAIEYALENESNTLFLDSDMILVNKITDTFHKKLVMSPHYWGAHKEYGIYNAGYLFCADKEFVPYWRDLYLNKSAFCEQEATNYFTEKYDIDIFEPDHNHGFWRTNYELPKYTSFHCHLFGLQGRDDKTAEKQSTHREFVLEYLEESGYKEHKGIRNGIEMIDSDKFEGKLPIVEGQYCDDWATATMSTPVKSRSAGRINLSLQTIFNSHRSGWLYAMNALVPLHNEVGIRFDGFLEDNFAWKDPRRRQIYKEPWVGFFHNPGNVPDWFFGEFSIENIIDSPECQESLESCQGLFVLSEDHAKCIRELTDVPVSVLYHPTEIPDMIFSYKAFLDNKNKKVVNIGYWLRKLNSIYCLPVNNEYEKWRLIPYTTSRTKEAIDKLLYHERELYNIESTEYFNNTKTIERVSNHNYDKLLSENIVFLDLYNSSANNAIIECIARTTPILVNPIPAVVEYLGEDYPFYFDTLDEAASKLKDYDLINRTHLYLKHCDIRQKLSQKYFRQSLIESEVYQLL